MTRLATPEDCPDIRRVHLAASKGPDSLERENPNVLKWLDARKDEDYLEEMQKEVFVVAEREDRIVGFGAIDLNSQVIESLFVDPAFTRQGIATQLVALMESLAVEAGLASVELQAAGGALTFYKKSGFEYITQPPKDGPLWAQMRKTLPAPTSDT